MSETVEQARVMQTDETVEIVRSVRIGRLILVGSVVGAVVAVAATLSNPVAEEALYTMGQITGFMLVLGAVIGMALGTFLALILNIMARRKRGKATARHSDVEVEFEVFETEDASQTPGAASTAGVASATGAASEAGAASKPDAAPSTEEVVQDVANGTDSKSSVAGQ